MYGKDPLSLQELQQQDGYHTHKPQPGLFQHELFGFYFSCHYTIFT